MEEPEKGKVCVDVGLNYRYLFEGTEKRPLSVTGFNDRGQGTGNSGKELKLTHYALAGRVGQINKPFFPLANVLTRDLRVKPGSQLDGIINFSVQHKSVILDFLTAKPATSL